LFGISDHDLLFSIEDKETSNVLDSSIEDSIKDAENRLKQSSSANLIDEINSTFSTLQVSSSPRSTSVNPKTVQNRQNSYFMPFKPINRFKNIHSKKIDNPVLKKVSF
ncbi:MAG: hypothetical protein MHPSP_001101, partial [Paramarteilia canceri]